MGKHYTEKLVNDGFVQGVSAPTVFYNATSGVRCVVHGDDFTSLGEQTKLEALRALMAEWYEIKLRGIMGSSDGDIKGHNHIGTDVAVASRLAGV